MKTTLMGLILLIMAFRSTMADHDYEKVLHIPMKLFIEMVIATIAMSLIHFYL